MYTLNLIVWRREMEMRDMDHLPRDMDLPVHPAVKNDEKFFHCRETGDGDAGYGYPGPVLG